MSNPHILMIFVTRLKFAVERLAENKSVNFQQDENGYILFNYGFDFKFVLWINCEAELIREEKRKKRRRARHFELFACFMPDARKCLTRPGRT